MTQNVPEKNLLFFTKIEALFGYPGCLGHPSNLLDPERSELFRSGSLRHGPETKGPAEYFLPPAHGHVEPDVGPPRGIGPLAFYLSRMPNLAYDDASRPAVKAHARFLVPCPFEQIVRGIDEPLDFFLRYAALPFRLGDRYPRNAGKPEGTQLPARVIEGHAVPDA